MRAAGSFKRSVLVAAVLAMLAVPAAAGERQRQKLRTARAVYVELMEAPDRRVPQRLLESSRCVAVIPGVIKGAFGWGGRHGRGVLSCKRGGSWTAPVFVTLAGGSFGLQIGGQASDFVLFFLTERSVRSLLETEFTLGGDVSVAAGPAGRSAEATTDLKLKAEIFSYAKSRGLFAGLSVEGARLGPKKRWIRSYYGPGLTAEAILFDNAVPQPPPDARAFLEVLP